MPYKPQHPEIDVLFCPVNPEASAPSIPNPKELHHINQLNNGSWRFWDVLTKILGKNLNPDGLIANPFRDAYEIQGMLLDLSALIYCTNSGDKGGRSIHFEDRLLQPQTEILEVIKQISYLYLLYTERGNPYSEVYVLVCSVIADRQKKELNHRIVTPIPIRIGNEEHNHYLLCYDVLAEVYKMVPSRDPDKLSISSNPYLNRPGFSVEEHPLFCLPPRWRCPSKTNSTRRRGKNKKK